MKPQTVARLATTALWGVGSAYLIKSELSNAQPDWVVIVSTPVVWAVVISLPLLATHARLARQWLAFILIWLAAISGSAYTLQSTIGRNAESRDVKVARAAEATNQRSAILKDLKAAKEMLDSARAKCGQGRECLQSTRATIGIYEGAVAGHEARLEKLTRSAPDAGERVIARLISFSIGANLENVLEIVSLISPSLFGITLELSAFAVAMFGWHPVQACARHFPAMENVLPPQHPVIAALEKVGRPVNNGELARLMHCCDAEATKRRREVAERLLERRSGKEVIITLLPPG
jgi:hypothetical protein